MASESETSPTVRSSLVGIERADPHARGPARHPRRRSRACRAARARALRTRRRRRRRGTRRRCASHATAASWPRRCGSPHVTTARSWRGGAAPASPAAPRRWAIRSSSSPRSSTTSSRSTPSSGWRGSSRECSTSTSAGRSRISACTTRPTRRRSRRARSAATSRPTPAARTASRPASPRRTCSRSRWCSPTDRTTMLGGLEPDQPGYDLRGCFVGSEGTMGIATRIAVRLTPEPTRGRARCCSTSPSIEDAGATVSGIIAAGIVPAALEMMDAQITRAVEDFVGAGYPRDAAAVLLVELDGLAGRRRRAGRGRRARRARERCPHRARRRRRRRARAAVEGPQVGVRRHRPHRSRLLPPRRGRPAHASSSTCSAGSTRSPPSSSSR